MTDRQPQLLTVLPTLQALHARPNAPWRPLGLAMLAGACALLSACGGGGGGGSSNSGSSNTTSVLSGSISATAFPLGVGQASPTALGSSGSLVAGATGVSPASGGTTRWPALGLVLSQTDAIATGRLALSGSGLLSASTLFATAAASDASCYGPVVAYTNHDDATGTNGSVAAGLVGLWLDTDPSSLACGAAEVDARSQAVTAQAQQALWLMAGLRAAVVADTSLSLPGAGSTLNLTNLATSLLQPVLSGVTVQTASLTMNSDASELTWRVVLTTGSGSTAQSLELALLHTPAETDTRFAGVLHLTLGYLSADANLGCSDQVDSATSRYKLTRATTVGYNRYDDWLSLRTRSATYCGNPTVTGSDHLAQVASLSLTSELDPAVYLSGATRGSTLGWRQGMLRLSSSQSLTTQAGDFQLAWQDAPAAGNGHAHLFSGHSDFNTGTAARSLALYHGHTDDISVTDGNLLGLACNDGAPGSGTVVQALFQSQALSLAGSAGNWSLGASHIAHAPTASCSSSATMAYDVNADNLIGSGEGASVPHDLLAPSQSGYSVQDELLDRGFYWPTLLL